MTPEERVAAIVAIIGGKTLNFSQSGVNFSVSNVHALASYPSCLVYSAEAWTGKGANKAFLPVDTEYHIVNPPLQVPDGGFDAKGRKTFVRNDLAAAKVMVYDQVTDYARAHGWQG